MSTYPFSLLRVEVDARRGEVVNVGIAVFLEDRLDVRMNPAGSKLRALDPNYDATHLANLDEWLQEVDSMLFGASAERRHRNLAVNGGLEIGPLAHFQLPTAAAYEGRVERLMDDLVYAPPLRGPQRTLLSRLETQLRKDFSKRGLFSANAEDIEHHKIVARYPVSTEEKLTADFALRNGTLHVFATVDLRGKPDTVKYAKFSATAVKAITLDRAGKTRNARPFAIIAAPESVLELAHPHINILNDYSERVFNIHSLEGHQALMAHVAEAATVD